MQKSMTGFGKTVKMFNKFDIMVEIKSVNGKYFDPSFRIPRIISSLEIEIRNLLQEKLMRGKIDFRAEVVAKTAVTNPILNLELFEKYRDIIDNIRNMAEIDDTPKIEHFLRLPDIIAFASDDTSEDELAANVLETVAECVSNLDNMRLEEGKALEKDIVTRLENLNIILNLIDEAKNGIFEYWLEKFKKRMKDMELVGGYEERIIQEAAIYGEKADITEEITRLRSHFTQFAKIMRQEFPAGKKLDFLCQEIHREFNTIASKSSKSEIIGAVVEAKAESDRIREQIQNLV